MRKIRVIPNWVDVEFYKSQTRSAKQAVELGLASRFNIIYAGSIGFSQGLDVVIEAASILKGSDDIQFVLVGDGTERDRLEAEIIRRRLSNVRLLSSVKQDSIPELLSLADVLLVCLRNDPLLRITVPHKIYSCLAMAKPILGAVEGEAATVILEARAGVTCPAGDALSLATAARKLRALSTKERETMGENGRIAACTMYTAEHLVPQIAEMLVEAIGGTA